MNQCKTTINTTLYLNCFPNDQPGRDRREVHERNGAIESQVVWCFPFVCTQNQRPTEYDVCRRCFHPVRGNPEKVRGIFRSRTVFRVETQIGWALRLVG